MANRSHSVESGGTTGALFSKGYQPEAGAPLTNGSGDAGVERETLEAERRRANQAEQFADTLARIGASPDLRSALAVLARDAISILRGDSGAIRAYGPDDGSVGGLAYWVDRDGHLEPADHPEPLPNSIAGELRAGGPSRLIHDLWELNPDLSVEERAEMRRGMRSSVAVPLMVNERRIGSLHVDHHEVGFFGATDLAVAEALATMAAATIERLRLQELAETQLEVTASLRALAEERDRALREARQALAERDIALQEAREALDLRDQFLTLASHELRTPITSLRGYAQLLLRQYRRGANVSPEQVQRALHLIDQQSEKLSRLAKQLVDTSRIESGNLVLECAPIDISQLVEEIATSTRTMLEITASVMQVDHTVSVDVCGPVIANVDRTRLEHVLVNLVDNAIRYSPNGGAIKIKVARDDASSVRIEVRDYGIGLPPHYQEQIFERFFQVQRHGNPGGMGLGLYVSRQIVELHGGKLWVEIPDDGGSCFILRLPLDAEPPASAPSIEPDPAQTLP